MTAALALASCGDDGGDANPEKTAASPVTGTLVGRVAGDDAYVALVSDGEQVAGYLCDGDETSLWLGASEIDDGRAELVSRFGETIGEVEFDEEGASGEVRVGDEAHGFAVAPTSGESGLYRAVVGTPGEVGAVEAGWIVLTDGSARGAKNSFTSTETDLVVGPAPALVDNGGNGVVDLGQGQRARVRKLGPSFTSNESDF